MNSSAASVTVRERPDNRAEFQACEAGFDKAADGASMHPTRDLWAAIEPLLG